MKDNFLSENFSGDSFSDYDYEDPHPAKVAAYYIWTHIPPVILPLGTMGNMLTIMVFSRRGMKESLTSLLFRTLAVFDTIALLESLESIFALSGFKGIASHKIACKICYCIFDTSKGGLNLSLIFHF